MSQLSLPTPTDACCGQPSLLVEGETCWKIATAAQATLLVDGQEYFAILREALLGARRQVLIAGWDFDTRTVLPRCRREVRDGGAAPLRLGELLAALLRERPGLEIHVLRWDHHAIYRRDREPDTQLQLERCGVRFHSDGAHPVTGCVHHKVVVVDDALAFCGGIDLTHQRWDSCQHASRDPRRRDHCGKSYQATHDTQLCVSGPIAQVLGEYVRDCWRISTGAAPRRVHCEEEVWPPGLRVDFRHIRAGVARTVPAYEQLPAIRQIETLYLRAIAAASHELYFENQYFTSTRIAQAIAEQCRRRPQLQGLLVSCERPRTWIEHQTMGYGRSRCQQVLAAAGAAERMPLAAALNSAGQPILVHSKLAIFDDRLLMVGSANLNRRSMGFDVECNLALEAGDAQQRQAIAGVRNRLLAEHLDLQPAQVAAAIQKRGLAGLPAAVQHRRRLVPVGVAASQGNFGPVLAPLFDREELWRVRRAPAARPGWHHALAWFCFICYFMLSASSQAH